MREERVSGTLTYTGTSVEIAECLMEHADSGAASPDAAAALEMRRAAMEVKNGERTEFRDMAHFRVAHATDSAKAEVS